ncbi:metallophosphoesterase [Paenibacillus crassostreae]|uniref:Phosphoesterase n=1 Tax=Paenibacillus crassostreae TaxID=1763538 RepID=A0A167EVH0_9BACL|nr:metallophosphoesterase [Paenibacillus crassostreae]AOZ93428.1 phosphoesterase [Paenibacillus crassostreae]OAB75917.1 phosphoesterase [Paenibacillus crassostreae]
MFILIGVIFILLYALLVFYIGWSGWKWMKPTLSLKFKLLYIFTIIFLSSSFILARLFNNLYISIIGSYWLALFSLLLLLLPLVHITVWLLRLTSLPRHHVLKWSGVITLILLISLLSYGSFNAFSPIIRTYDITIAKKSTSSEPLKIVMASDMHFSVLSGKNHATGMVDEINALNPDIVLFPGDIFDDQVEQYIDQGIGPILAKIQAPYGVYASLGNHDKYEGTMAELIDILEQSNIHVLYDESITIDDRFTLIGRKDHSDPDRILLSDIMKDLDLSKPMILLDHQPKDFDIAQQQGIDLMVSGHTHHGQIAPANLITQRLFENDWGLLQKHQFHSIVTSGFGFWGPPIRIGSRAEIVQINVMFGL